MLIFFFLFLLTIFCFFAKYKTGMFFNPLNIVIVFWTVWIIISIINPFNLYDVELITYFYLLLFIIFFSIGFLLVARRIQSSKDDFESKIIVNKSIPIIINIFVSVILLYFLFKYNSLLIILGVLEARNIKFEIGLLFSNTFEYLLFSVIISSIVYLSFLLSTVNYLKNKKITGFFAISIINILLYSYIGLGRMAIFETGIFLILAFIFSKIFILFKLKIWHKISFLLLAIFAIGSIMNITTKRLNSTLTEKGIIDTLLFTLEQGAVYFTGPISAFNHFISLRVPENTGYTFGSSTFGGIDYFIGMVFSYIGYPYQTANDKTGSFTQPAIQIGNDHTFNAFYTGLMNFYMDFGYFGIIVFSLIFGFTLGLIWNKYLKNGNAYTLSLLIFICYTGIVSEYRLPYSSISTWVILITLLMLNRFRNKKLILH